MVFLETCKHLKKQHHMIIECIPMPKEIGEMSPIYFKVGLKGDTGKTKWNSYQWTFFLIYSLVSFFCKIPLEEENVPDCNLC